jgi:predicted kinase
VLDHNAAVVGRVLYLLGGPPRVGKSSMAQRLLTTDGIPWLPTDVIRTTLRRVLPELDAIDQDPVDPTRLAELMYPHIEQAAEVCVEEADCFLIEGFELAPSYRDRLRTALTPTDVRACFVGHRAFTADDLAHYRGPKPQHDGATRSQLDEAAGWIRGRSVSLESECRHAGVPYVEIADIGFEEAITEVRRIFLRRN